MSGDGWDRISIQDANALNDLADRLQHLAASAGRQERRHKVLNALKEAFELGVKSTTHVAANDPAANE